jgi:hypothetical protein
VSAQCALVPQADIADNQSLDAKTRLIPENGPVATDYTIDPSNRLVRVIYSGRVTIAEMYDRRRRLVAEPAFDSTFAQLVDARAVTSFEINGYTIKPWAEQHVAATGARRAIVLSRSADLGLARMFQIYRELAGGTEEIQLFNDIDQAQKWLGLA